VTGLLALALLEFRKSKNAAHLFFWFAPLAAWGGLYFVVFEAKPDLRPKGDENHQDAFLAILYLCMVIGMASSYLYSWVMKISPEPFDTRRFLAPIFASPLVFIPLLGAFQDAKIDLTKITGAKLMIFFVAFQNGFFWQQVIKNRQKG